MTPWRDCQRLRLRVPVTPQVAAALALPSRAHRQERVATLPLLGVKSSPSSIFALAARPSARRKSAITLLSVLLKNP